MKRRLRESKCGCWVCCRCIRGKWRSVVKFHVKDLTKLELEAQTVGSNGKIAHLFFGRCPVWVTGVIHAILSEGSLYFTQVLHRQAGPSSCSV